MERTKLIMQVQNRLASLEKERAETSILSNRYAEICVEMDHLRVTLQQVMNNVCPIIKN